MPLSSRWEMHVTFFNSLYFSFDHVTCSPMYGIGHKLSLFMPQLKSINQKDRLLCCTYIARETHIYFISYIIIICNAWVLSTHTHVAECNVMQSYRDSMRHVMGKKWSLKQFCVSVFFAPVLLCCVTHNVSRLHGRIVIECNRQRFSTSFYVYIHLWEPFHENKCKEIIWWM